ncbi:MAG: GAF domain-containing protein, partial [Burkholderiales bacterium]|nr:GAF domain-containing protein [Burkholderiales bacterium]
MTFLAGQSRVLELVATSAPLTDVLLLMTQLIEAEAPGLLCGVVLVDEGGTHLHSGVGPSLAELMCALQGMSIDPPLEPCGTAVYTRGVVVVPHIDSDHRWSPQFRDLAQRHSLQSCLCMPMLGRQGQVLGSIAMYRRLPGDAMPSDYAIAQVASQLGSIAIERKMADLALVDTGRKLAAQAHDMTATQLAKIIELAPAFMAVFRGPTLIIEMANDAYRQLVGQRELIGLPVRQAFPEVSGQGL